MNKLFIILLLIFSSVSYADSITRQEINIMHKLGVRMALEGERPYVVRKNTSPQKIVRTELLDLSGLGLQNVPLWLNKFNNLRKLDVSDNEINASHFIIYIATTPSVGKIEVLNLSGNKGIYHNDQVNDSWKKFKNLKVLDISGLGASIDDIDPSKYGYDLAEYPKSLMKINFSNNNLSFDSSFYAKGKNSLDKFLMDEGDRSEIYHFFKNLPNIREINLSNTNIDLEKFEILYKPARNSIEVLDIRNNKGKRLNKSFKDPFYMPNLVQLKIDSHILVPKTLKKILD